jgi:hypothetical protein
MHGYHSDGFSNSICTADDLVEVPLYEVRIIEAELHHVGVAVLQQFEQDVSRSFLSEGFLVSEGQRGDPFENDRFDLAPEGERNEMIARYLFQVEETKVTRDRE